MSENKGTEQTGETAPAVSNLEWVVRVFRALPNGHRQSVAISRPFADQKKAEDFFEKTIPVHQAKANRGEANAYVVVLASQDPRKHLKAAERGWNERAWKTIVPNAR